MDYEIPSNQEAMTKFMDLDLTINLGETSYVKHNLTEEYNEIKKYKTLAPQTKRGPLPTAQVLGNCCLGSAQNSMAPIT